MLRFVMVALAAVMLTTSAMAGVYVHGYFRSNGTYVQPYYRSSPDSSYNNNWSVYPNVNPYTGKMGTRAPTWNDRPPTYNPYGAYGTYNPYGGYKYNCIYCQ